MEFLALQQAHAARFSKFSNSKRIIFLLQNVFGSTVIIVHLPMTNANATSLSNEEINRLTTLIENDDQFQQLMVEYVKEISDPKHRAEQEAYLKHLEEQNEIPEGKRIIRPLPAFVLKFKYTEKADKPSSKRKHSKKKKKLFVNVVYSDSIEKPISRKSKANELNGASGTHWSLPYLMGPLRMEYDTTKNQVSTLDCCFHPEVLVRGTKSNAFRDLIANVAKEGSAIKMQKNPNSLVDIHPFYRILKGVEYMSGSPSLLMVPCHSEDNDETNSSNPTYVRERDASAEKKIHDLNLQENPPIEISQNNGIKKGFLATSNSNSDPIKKNRSGDSTDRKGVGKTSDTKVIPHYEVIEKGEFDLLDQTKEALKNQSTRPKFIEYRIALPRINNIKQIDLDVREDKMTLASLPESEAEYHLSIHFPYQIVVDSGIAKFDQSSKQLIVTLPVYKPKSETRLECPQYKSDEAIAPSTSVQSHCAEIKSKHDQQNNSMTIEGDLNSNNGSEVDTDTQEEQNICTKPLTGSTSPIEMIRKREQDVNHSRWLNCSSPGYSTNSSIRKHFAVSEKIAASTVKNQPGEEVINAILGNKSTKFIESQAQLEEKNSPTQGITVEKGDDDNECSLFKTQIMFELD